MKKGYGVMTVMVAPTPKAEKKGLTGMATLRTGLRSGLRWLSVLGLIALTGCAGTRTVDEKSATLLLQNSDYQTYASRFLDGQGQPKYDPDSLLDSLEAGKAFNDAGLWQFSSEAFEAAGKLLHWKEDTVDTPAEVASLIGTTLTSDAFGPYQGKIHQGSLIDYYQAINMLMLGRESDARVDFNRLQVRQDNALTQLSAYAATVKKSVGEGMRHEQGGSARQSLSGIGPQVAQGVQDLPAGVSQAKIRHAAGDLMSALFRATSSAQSDKQSNLSRDMLRQASGASATREGNALITHAGRQINTGRGALKNHVIVLYEDGVGPGYDEFRIDLPLFIVTGKVSYTGIALPRFRPGQSAFGGLRLDGGRQPAETVTLTNINELAGLEFDAAYRGIVTKAVLSTVIKTAAQAAINHQIDREAGNSLVGGLLKIGVGTAQYALTQADTRNWVNLPNTIQMALVERPASGKLRLVTMTGIPLSEIELPEAGNVLVLVKAAGAQAPPAVYVQALPTEAPATKI